MAMMIPQISKKQTGWRFFLQTVLGRSYPRTVGQMRDVSWLFFDVLLPMLSVSAYVFVYRAIQAPEDYVGFVVVGGAMTAFWTNVLWSMSTQLYWEKEQGNLPLYIISPASLMAILLGMALGGLVSTTLRAVVIILLGSLLFHVNYVLVSLPELLAVFFLCMTALYGLGMMTASIFLMFSREAWHWANLAQEPVYLASGFYFPIRSFPLWISSIASLIPLTLGLDAMRQLVFASGPTLGFLSVQIEIFILIGLCVVFLMGAKLLLGRMERLAIHEGRLTESRR
ncbi:MAG: ABC transporter permease [Anaerolineaceae bacterium]|jgi:ABC-2 type transport system permease protein